MINKNFVEVRTTEIYRSPIQKICKMMMMKFNSGKEVLYIKFQLMKLLKEVWSIKCWQRMKTNKLHWIPKRWKKRSCGWMESYFIWIVDSLWLESPRDQTQFSSDRHFGRKRIWWQLEGIMECCSSE